MKKLFYLLLVILTSGTLYAQSQEVSLVPHEMVSYYQQQGKEFIPAAEVLTPVTLNAQRRSQIGNAVTDATVFNFDQLAAKKLAADAPDQLTFSLPLANGKVLKADLVKVNIFAEGFFVNTDLNPKGVDVPLGVHYRGVIQGEEGSIAAISIFDQEIMGLFSSPEQGNRVLGRLEGDNPSHDHILYNDANLTRDPDFQCDTPDDGEGYTSEELQGNSTQRNNALDCIKVYLEVDSDIRANKGGVMQAVWYVTGAFHQVATLYAAEGLNYQLSQVFVWATAGPYTNGSTAQLLNQFKARISSLNGNFGHLLTFRSSGGLAAGFNGLCNSNVNNSLCVSDIFTSYSTVPTYSWTVMVMTHEMGHLNGSRHTHACVWNGNNTAIDGCAGFTEGSCAVPGYPAGGGTIMSYCHLSGRPGINFSKGFGLQPGNVIRNAASAAPCTCAGGPVGGAVPYNQIISLQAAVNMRFVAAENGGNSFLIANRTAAGPWERFQVINAGGGMVALRALVNNRYVVAENGGNDDLLSNRTAIGLWEKFTWINNSDGTVSLRSAANNKYVTAENGGNNPLIANRTAIGLWEKFYIHSQNFALVEDGNSLPFKAWPNPVEHYIFLQGVAPGSQLEVVDLQGKTILRSTDHEYVVVNELPAGMYFLRIDGEMKYRFVKQ